MHPRRPPESLSPSTEEKIVTREREDEIVFAFETRLRVNLNAAEMSGDGTYAWAEFTRRAEKILRKNVPHDQQATLDLSKKTIQMALCAQEALPKDASERDALIKYAENKGPAGMATYRAQKNARSLDGLPGVTITEEAA